MYIEKEMWENIHQNVSSLCIGIVRLLEFVLLYIFAYFLNENRLITNIKDKKYWKINDKYCL